MAELAGQVLVDEQQTQDGFLKQLSGPLQGRGVAPCQEIVQAGIRKITDAQNKKILNIIQGINKF